MSIQVGQAVSVKRAFTQSDFDRFAVLSGDDNPIHVDAEFAARTKFGQTVAHGMFLYSTVCSVLGTRLPGPGTVQVEQELVFPSATYVGEEVTIQLQVTRVQPAEGLAELTTSVIRPSGDFGLRGRTLVRLPNMPAQDSIIPNIVVSQFLDSGSFKGLKVGKRAETCRIFTEGVLGEYASLTGDTNPVFCDGGYAHQLGLEGQMIPGGLLGGLFSDLLGTRLPGWGTNYLKQRLFFPIPAYVGQEIMASVEIVRIRPEKQLVNLSTVCLNPAGQIVCQGEALVLVSDMKRGA